MSNEKERALFQGYSIIECALRNFSDIYILLQKDGQDLDEENTLSRLIVYSIENKNWQLVEEFEELNFESMTFCSKPEERLLIMDEDGEMISYGQNSYIKEADIPGGEDSYMNKIAIMNGQGRAYAVGSERHIWRRIDESQWQSIHESTHTPDMEDKDGGDMGFSAISGFSEKDIYVSGNESDTWHYDGKQWHPVELPTNQTIHSVLCAGNDQVYLCGNLGCLMKGRGDHWKTIESDALSNARLDCLTWFDGNVYVSTPKSLLRINNEDVVEPVMDVLPISSFTVGVVKANQFMLVACGVGTVRMYDGKTWHLLAQY